MSEQKIRTESLEPLHELSNELARELGEQPEARLDWLMDQTADSFGDVLLRINAQARGFSASDHAFDGEGVKAGTVGGSIPPDQEDKIELLGELVGHAQQFIINERANSEDPQTIVTELAMAMPTIINKLHLFSDGNGRTSRILRMLLRDSDQLSQEKIDAVVNKDMQRYDATPGPALEFSTLKYFLQDIHIDEVSIDHDLIDDTAVPDDAPAILRGKFPDIDPSVVKAYLDSNNFDFAVGLMTQEKGEKNLQLTQLFQDISEKPDELQRFTSLYKDVRKLRVEYLMKGLLGELPIPFTARNKTKEIERINIRRKIRKLPSLDPDMITTVQDYQMAYCETFSPDHTTA